MWLSVSSMLIDLLQKRKLASQISHSISKVSVKSTGLMYVDDTDLMRWGTNGTGVYIHNDLQQMLSTWVSGLEVSGGALSQKKCYWYSLEYKKNKLIPETPPLDLYFFPRKPSSILEKLPTAAAKEVVGVWLQPNGQDEVQFKVTQQKLQTLTQGLTQCHLSRHLCWRGFLSCVWKSLNFPLGATSFTQSQASSLMKPLWYAMLPLLGINRHFPRKLINVPAF